MSFARKTLKILALIYFVLGIASLVIASIGIANGRFDSVYGSNAMLAAVVLVIKGVIDLAAGVAGIKGANKPSQVDGAFKLGIVAAIATIAQAVLTLPAFGGSAVNMEPLSSWSTTCSLFSRHTPSRPRTRTACKRSLLIASCSQVTKRADRAYPRSALYVCPDNTCQNKPVPFWQVVSCDGTRR